MIPHAVVNHEKMSVVWIEADWKARPYVRHRLVSHYFVRAAASNVVIVVVVAREVVPALDVAPRTYPFNKKRKKNSTPNTTTSGFYILTTPGRRCSSLIDCDDKEHNY